MRSIGNILNEQFELVRGLNIRNTSAGVYTLSNKCMPEATYVGFSDTSKIYALEGIIDNAKDVFGPYGGIYMNLYTSPTTKQTILSKSKDGHKFFQNLNFLSVNVETVLASIRERTLYVSGSNGKTSRDGTTSLAVVSSAVSSDILLNRVSNPDKFTVPSSIVSATFEYISQNFRNLVDERKHMIYNNEDCSYIEGGFEAARNAIATTVDRNPIMVDAYVDLMEECAKHKIDITYSSKAEFPEKIIDGTPGFRLRLDTGLRVFASSLEKTKPYAFRDSKAPIIFLDGFIGDHVAKPFHAPFKKFLNDLLTIKDPDNGFYMFSKYNPNGIEAPIFFYNRSTDAIRTLFEQMQNYVELKMKDPETGNIITETISPRFIFLESEDTSKESYNDLLDIFSENVISFNGYRRYIADEARKNLTPELSMQQGGKPYQREIDAVNLHDMFKVDSDEGVIGFANIKYNADVPDELSNDSVTSVEHVEVNVKDLLASCTFNGGMIFISTVVEENRERMIAKKERLSNIMEQYSKSSAEYESVKMNLNMYNTASITPIFTVKTEDEYEIMYDLYQDAQGIFESVHVHGVMGGGNTTIFKVIDKLYDNTLCGLADIYKGMPNMSSESTDRYIKFAEMVLDSITRGYVRSYKTLLRKNMTDVLNLVDSYRTLYSEDPTVTYNIITGNFDKGTLESTRTTVDTFQAALDVAYDMLNTRRVRIQKESEVVEMYRDFDDKKEFKVAETMLEYYNL